MRRPSHLRLRRPPPPPPAAGAHHAGARRERSSSSDDRRRSRRVVHVRSALAAGPVPYETGWAWQRVLLDRRLECARRRAHRLRRDDDGDSDPDDDDRDCLLLFEHEPTYTLGRGASVDHLTFLNDDRRRGGDVREDDRRRLGKGYRGADASRLQAVSNRSRDVVDDHHGRRRRRMMSVEDEVDLVLSDCRIRASAHPPVLAPNGAPVHRVERGGEVTFHGPGQLVMYPLLNLDDDDDDDEYEHGGATTCFFRKDLHWYLRSMEEVVIRTLARYGLESRRDPDAGTGVWVADGGSSGGGLVKIAAVGVSSSRWITTHGAALNVRVDMGYFDGSVVTPCGIGDRGVTSLARSLGDRGRRCSTVEEVGRVATECFGEVFGVDLIRGETMIR